MGNLTNYGESKLLDHQLKNTAFTRPEHLYLALCTADPTESATGSSVTEPSGGGYARQIVDSWDAATARATANSAEIAFPEATAAWGTISHWAICDALTGGNAIAYGDIDPDKAIYTGDTAKIAVGDLDISYNTGAISTAIANALLDHVFAGTPYSQPTHIYAALLTATPDDDDSGSTITEPGENYARKLHDTWDASVDGVSENDGDITFVQANSTGWGTVTHFALCDSLETGNVLRYGSFAASKIIGNSDVANIPDGELVITQD